MPFDLKIHITHKLLAAYLRLTPNKLKAEIRKFETPLKKAGRTNIAGEQVTFYDRTAAIEWASLWVQYDAIARQAATAPAKVKGKPLKWIGQKAAPRTPKPFKELQTDQLTRIAYARAEVQPPMITPNGYGDYSRSRGGEFSHR